MPRELFVERRFNSGSLLLIEQANTIIREYQEQGFTLTLRQLYYQFVARAIIPNKQTEYKRLGSVINDARLAGMIDWNAIEDRTRNLRKDAAWGSPEEIIAACASQYREDLWADQPYYPEVWIEKDALVGVIEPVCSRYRVPYFACRGYSSQSEQWRAGKRFAGYIAGGQKVIVFHLGDHDPSGIDMTRDNEERLSMFAGGPVEVKRLALNMNQVEQYSPPPNPAKETDSRAEDYIRKYGSESWELDALEPQVIDQLIAGELDEIIDPVRWSAAKEKEGEGRGQLREVSKRWDEVIQHLDGE